MFLYWLSKYIFQKNNILRVYIMALIVGHNGPSAYASTIANRTGQSGGSVGGVKKAGIWSGQPFMSVYNVGNSYTFRAPQSIPTLAFSLRNTTRNPLQYKRGSYAVTHSGMM
jgi:hypothetical protein